MRVFHLLEHSCAVLVLIHKHTTTHSQITNLSAASAAAGARARGREDPILAIARVFCELSRKFAHPGRRQILNIRANINHLSAKAV